MVVIHSIDEPNDLASVSWIRWLNFFDHPMQPTFGPPQPRVVVMDDDPLLRTIICTVATAVGCPHEPAASMSELGRVLGDGGSDRDLVFLDMDLGDTDGITVLRFLQERSCRARIVIFSGCHPRILRSAKEFGVSLGLTMLPPLPKPFDLEQVESVIQLHSRAFER